MILLCLLLAEVPLADPGGTTDPLLKKFILDEGAHEKFEGFTAPGGRFRVKVPERLQRQEGQDPDTVTFAGELGSGTPVLLIFRRVPVTPGASPAQLMLVTRDRFTEKLPGFTVLKQDRVKISGRPCAWMMGRYDYQGNRAYPQVIENAYVVDGADGYIIHTEVPESLYNDAVPMLTDVYKTFKTMPPPQDKPTAPPAPTKKKKK